MSQRFTFIITVIVFAFLFHNSGYGQLVKKKDYDAAFALQAGGAYGGLFSDQIDDLKITPTFGLKITFPFTRKWFLGTEINYDKLSLKSSYSEETNGQAAVAYEQKVKYSRITVPLYVKYMLNSNRASILFGVYAAWNYDRDVSMSRNNEGGQGDAGNPEDLLSDNRSPETESWDAGLLIGYEQRIVKHLNLTLKVMGGLKEGGRLIYPESRSFYPIQASLTLSYDIFRIGDCGCD